MIIKGCTIEPYRGTQINYGAQERAAKGENIRLCDFDRKRQFKGWIITEPDGYQRLFKTKKQAAQWIDKNYE